MREKLVEEKLRCEVLLLETRIAEIHNNIDKQKARIRAAHQNDTHDVATKKSLFLVLKCLTGQSRRYNELLKVCSSMLDHVQEQLLMTETKQVLNEFAAVHQHLTKPGNMEKMVEQYADISSNLAEMREDFAAINGSLNPESPHGVDKESDLELELEMFLKEGESENALSNGEQHTAPTEARPSDSFVANAPAVEMMESSRPVESYFEDTPEKLANLA